MFDYLKKLKGSFTQKHDEKPTAKPKKDKAFIIILIIFGAIILFSTITGINNVGNATHEMQRMEYSFNFSMFDGIFIVVITILYLIFRFRKGRK